MKISLISLGCAKNLVDSEVMVGALRKEGMELTPHAADADAVIVNTCSFIDASKQESINIILEADAGRGKNTSQALIVAGCLSQRYSDRLKKEMPEVDAFIGLDQITQIPSIVRAAIEARRKKIRLQASGFGVQSTFVTPKSTYIPDYATPRFRLTPKHFAYVKIAEGCNHPCSFCIIPQIRGKHRSRPQHDILAEARQLVADGCREINLVSQDTTFYGLDLQPRDRFSGLTVRAPAGGTPSLCSLLRELNRIEGDFWIRLLYTHPAHWSDELIETIASCEKVARYVDMPLQHIHEEMLDAMRRETSQEYIVDLIRRIRAGIPGMAIRTTFIVGFPGETEAHFQTLLDFIRETRFERVGVFTYSHEENTRAFKRKNQIPAKLKKERRDRAMAVQQQVAKQIGSAFVGNTLRVLVEGENNSESVRHLAHSRSPRFAFLGRSHADAPEIDGFVYIEPNAHTPKVGEFADVRVTGHSDYDLYGTVV